LAKEYRLLIRAGLSGDDAGLRDAAVAMQFIDGSGAFDDRILEMMRTVFSAVTAHEQFDFSDRTLTRHLNQQDVALAEAGYTPPVLPMDVLYLQRKFGGMFLLASRLGASLPVRKLMERFLD
jgi:hypothetical protein